MMSFCVVPWSAGCVDALLLGRDDVEGEQPRRRRVDRHRRVHLVERDAVEQRAHVAAVGDRDADLADLAARELVVGVVAGLGRQVEGDRQAGLALGQVRAVQRVRGLRRRVAGVRAHHPGPVGLGEAGRRRHCAAIVWSGPCPAPSARRARTSLRLRALDARDRVAGRAGPLVPPRRMQLSVGEGDFGAIGDEFLSHLVGAVRPAGRRPRARRRLRDRPARAAAGRLPVDRRRRTPASTSAPTRSRWCTRRYRHYPNFAFVHADVRNAPLQPGRHDGGGRLPLPVRRRRVRRRRPRCPCSPT